MKLQDYKEPCDTCKYQLQACAYIIDGKKIEDACLSQKIWLKSNNHNNL